MVFTRRHAFSSAPAFALAVSLNSPNSHVVAQGAAPPVGTPAGTPIVDYSESLLDRLLEAPVRTPLFPADTGRIQPAPWIDEGDTDLIGTVGGVLMQTGQDENRNFIGPGVYLVFPDAGAALARLDASIAEAEEDFEGVETQATSIDMAGYPGFTISSPDSTVTLLAVGPVIVSALGNPNLPGDPALRSLVNGAALLDHLLSIMS